MAPRNQSTRSRQNYAGILILWDRMFGTFAEEDPEEPSEYGVISPIVTLNPLKIATLVSG